MKVYCMRHGTNDKIIKNLYGFYDVIILSPSIHSFNTLKYSHIYGKNIITVSCVGDTNQCLKTFYSILGYLRCDNMLVISSNDFVRNIAGYGVDEGAFALLEL